MALLKLAIVLLIDDGLDTVANLSIVLVAVDTLVSCNILIMPGFTSDLLRTDCFLTATKQRVDDVLPGKYHTQHVRPPTLSTA